MRILFFANLIPYPLDGGGKIFTFSVLKSLKESGHVIDLLCFFEKENIHDAKGALADYCDTITAIPIKVTTRENMKLMMIKAGISVFSTKPLCISKYINNEMIKIIKEKIDKNRYDCAFFNILAMYGYSSIVKKCDSRIRTVLYEQNCETLIYRRYLFETNNFLKKCFLKNEIRKLEKFEQHAINSVDKLILLSEEDKAALKVDRDDCSVIPIGVNPSNYQKKFNTRCDNVIRMLFIGTMTWAPNNEGIIWFLENVMPMCADKSKYELYIIGKKPSDRVCELCKAYQNIHLLGYVDSLEEYYEKCDVLVVPLFIGSGQRVKIIESFSKAFPVISTSIGLEGLKYNDGETVMVANSAYEFKQMIDKCTNYVMLSSVGVAGKKIFDSEYSTEVIKENINRAIT